MLFGGNPFGDEETIFGTAHSQDIFSANPASISYRRVMDPIMDEIDFMTDQIASDDPEQVEEANSAMEAPAEAGEQNISWHEFRNYRHLLENADSPVDWVLGGLKSMISTNARMQLKMTPWAFSAIFGGPIGILIGLGGMIYEWADASQKLFFEDPQDMEEWSFGSDARDIGIDLGVAVAGILPLGAVAGKVVKGVATGATKGAAYASAKAATSVGAKGVAWQTTATTLNTVSGIINKGSNISIASTVRGIGRGVSEAKNATAGARAGARTFLRYKNAYPKVYQTGKYFTEFSGKPAGERSLYELGKLVESQVSWIPFAEEINTTIKGSLNYIKSNKVLYKAATSIKGKHIGLSNEDSLFGILSKTAKWIVVNEKKLKKLEAFLSKVEGAFNRTNHFFAKASALENSFYDRMNRPLEKLSNSIMIRKAEQMYLKAEIMQAKAQFRFIQAKMKVYAKMGKYDQLEGLRPELREAQHRAWYPTGKQFKRKALTPEEEYRYKRMRHAVGEDIHEQRQKLIDEAWVAATRGEQEGGGALKAGEIMRKAEQLPSINRKTREILEEEVLVSKPLPLRPDPVHPGPAPQQSKRSRWTWGLLKNEEESTYARNMKLFEEKRYKTYRTNLKIQKANEVRGAQPSQIQEYITEMKKDMNFAEIARELEYIDNLVMRSREIYGVLGQGPLDRANMQEFILLMKQLNDRLQTTSALLFKYEQLLAEFQE